MATILNIETSGHNCSVALNKNGQLIAQQLNTEGLKHAEVLHVMMANVFKETDIVLTQIEAVAISEGPGSYTGLRIGASAAKGLCYALGIPLISVNTLAIYAQTLLKNKQVFHESIITCIDARRDEIYFAVYENGIETTPAQSKILDENFYSSFDTSKSYVITGNGSDKTLICLENKINIKKIELFTIEAKYMYNLALEKFNKNEFADLAYFEPNYLKPFFTTAKLTSKS
jgi:tRNA threonylcarbamoyladenosine biosynthesis protein TsaB